MTCGALLAAAAVGAAQGAVPLAFEENVGQTDPRAAFLCRGPGFGLFLTSDGAVVSLAGDADEAPVVLRMSLAGAASTPEVTGLGLLSGRSHYLRGNDPEGWHANVPRYARVRYREVLPGIDLLYHADFGPLELDFVVAPGADSGAIRMSFAGQTELALGPDGDLLLTTAVGEMRLLAPVAFQEDETERRTVDVRFALHGEDAVGFELGNYDRSEPLVIDPVLLYSTFLGGSAGDNARGIVAANGCTYVTGWTTSSDFPVDVSLKPPPAGDFDVFVAKLGPGGSELVYATYLGGSGEDFGSDLAVDALGNAYVAGSTTSSDFPTAKAVQPDFAGGGRDAFLVKLDRFGARLVYGTYLGGTAFDIAFGVDVDAAGRAHAAGFTASEDFPTERALQPDFGGGGPFGGDAFLTKLTASGAAFAYSTFLGGGGDEQGRDVAVTPDGEAVIVGTTLSDDFPTERAAQSSRGGGIDGFVTRVSRDGDRLAFSTYLGGEGRDFASGVTVDAAGNTYVAGDTCSPDFPVVAALQPMLADPFGDAFVAQYKSAGVPVFATYLGGDDLDAAFRVAVDGAGRPVVCGMTSSTDFPRRNPVQGGFRGGGSDAFVTRLLPNGTGILDSSYLGGSGFDFGSDLALDAGAHVHVTGDANGSLDFPTVNALEPTYQGGTTDGFVTKICFGGDGCRHPLASRRSTPSSAPAGDAAVDLDWLLELMRRGGSLLDPPEL